MTKNPGKPMPRPPDSQGYRQKIMAIEYSISTTMPGEIGLESLKQFAEKIIAAIEFLRSSSGQCKNKNAVIASLVEAKIPLQIAIDEAHPRGNNKRRYQNIALVGSKLTDALRNW